MAFRFQSVQRGVQGVERKWEKGGRMGSPVDQGSVLTITIKSFKSATCGHGGVDVSSP